MDSFPLGIIIAAFGGLAIGLERQWSGHATGPTAHFGGIRTFTLLGAVGGVSGWLWMQQVQAAAVVLLAASSALVIAAYVAASRTDIDGTTEVSAIVVIGAGLLAGLNHLTLSSGIVAVTALVLIEKSRLHAFAGRLDDEELRAAARFAVMAVVVLPLLPEGPYGPGSGIRPRGLWLLVLFFSGLSFAGYIARRAVGARHGYPLAGLIGGLVSSTSVTFTFSRASRETRNAPIPLAFGVVAACTVLFVRVAVAMSVLNRDLAWALLPYLIAPFVVGALILLTGLRHMHDQAKNPGAPSNPLQIMAALQMAVMFQMVLFGVDVIRRFWGEAGIVPTGAVLGLTDMDALTISMAREAASGIPLDVAARAVAMGLLSNTVLKLVVALAIGAPRFRRVVGMSLAAIGLAIGASFAWR